jgi:GTP-binding protein
MKKITTAVFIKGIVKEDNLLEDGRKQVAFIGRSNVGKSSTINAVTGKKGLARTSAFPGHTKEINLYLINNKVYLVDLPGYGFTKTSKERREKIQDLIFWYLIDSHYTQKKVIFIIDANIGLTENDWEALQGLEEKGKDIVIVMNKIDKVKPSQRNNALIKLQNKVGSHKIILFSAEKKIGINELTAEILT